MTGSELARDEKLCPYCAETIKAAAIKCRYCGSELPAGLPEQNESEPAAAGATTGAAENATDVADERTADGAEGTEQSIGRERPGRGWRASPWLSAVLTLALAASVVALLLGYRHNHSETASNGQITARATRAVLMDQAAKMTTDALSYDALHFDKGAARAKESMTAAMRQQYASTLAKVRPGVLKRGLVLRAKVQASGLIAATQHEARVLEFVDQTTTAKGVKRRQLNENRVVITLTNTDGRWLMSRLEAF